MIMTFKELLRYCIVQSGQQVLIEDMSTLNEAQTLDAWEMSFDDIWAIFLPEIQRYMRHCPIKKRMNRTAYGTGGGGASYNFTVDPSNIGYVDPDHPGQAPYWVTRAVPVSTFGAIPTLSGLGVLGVLYRRAESDYASPNRLVNLSVAPINYDPTIAELILPYRGTWDLTALYEYKITESRDVDGKLTDVEIDDCRTNYLGRYNIVKSLCLAAFKIQTGGAMKLVTNPFLEITNSGPQLVTEGLKLKKDMEELMSKTYPQHLIG